MSFTFEADFDLDAEIELQSGEFIGDYKEFFGDDDFDSLGIDPLTSTVAKPGSEDKVMMLAARYAAGLPLWHQDDCYDHAPSMLLDSEA